MAISAPQSSKAIVSDVPQNTGMPLAVVTTLFFMWGALTSLNDVLIPHFQQVFNLDLTRSVGGVQVAFFASYFVFSLPSARIIDWMGYQKAMVTGLLVMGLGAFLFVPAAKAPSYRLFLAALIVLAAGITLLQVAANPYVAVLGRPETASSRLNLTQAFNSLGTTIAPWIGGLFILSSAAIAMTQTPVQQAASVIKPYVFLGFALVALALAIASFKLPKIASAEHHLGEKIDDSIWKHPSLVYGAIGIFMYVGAEVAIGSSIANYLALDNIGHLVSPISFPDVELRHQEALRAAAKYISLYWGGAMVGRFIGSAILQKIKTSSVLAVCTVMAALLVTISVLSNGPVAMWSILVVGFFNSIMFPSIFTMGIAELGPLTGKGSGIMVMAIVGGAIVPLMVGLLGDSINAKSFGGANWGQGIHYAIIVPAFCYLYLLFFAVSGSKPNSERYARS
jgi:MFS transporter, FHS family, L-fucose permease